MKKLIKKILTISLLALLSLQFGFAANSQTHYNNDPFQHWNRKAFKFNEHLDKKFFVPIAVAYAKVVPAPARTSVSNFFENLKEPGVIANDILQGDFLHAISDSWRFFINTTFGLGGLFDVASKMNVPIQPHSNDFGITLRVWGLRYPRYFVVPFFGPSTDVDTLGRLVNYYAFSPIAYLNSFGARAGLLALYYVNGRARLLQFNNLLKTAALDPYVFIRNAYMQKRKSQFEAAERFIHAEYHSLEDNQPGYFLKPSHPWAKSKSAKKG